MCVIPSLSLFYRIVTGNNTNNKSESDQEDNDDVNDNDWSYGAEKKGNVPVSLLADAFNDALTRSITSKTECLSFTAKKRKSDKVHFNFPCNILKTHHILFF